MYGKEHYRKAEELLAEAGSATYSDKFVLLHAAQVHATLAQAAAASGLLSIGRAAERERGGQGDDERWRKIQDATKAEPLVTCGANLENTATGNVWQCTFPVGHDGPHSITIRDESLEWKCLGCGTQWETDPGEQITCPACGPSVEPASILNESIETGTPITVTDPDRCPALTGDGESRCVLNVSHTQPHEDAVGVMWSTEDTLGVIA